MARAHIPMNIMEESRGKEAGESEEDEHGPLIKYYKATELVPDRKPHLHRLFNKQPAVWASVQITCGILSLGLGVVFAVEFQIDKYFLTLFRVPIMTGIMFLFVGFLSNLLYKYPALLQMCFISNIVVLVMSVIGVMLLCVDLTKNHHNLSHEVEILLLIVTILDMAVSTILIVFINAEIRNQGKKRTSS
ncbi:hypothetical protein P4O66_004920 [Electrophorus voltai]|uniref:Uncharacterized protein n=1 Tax=Electrophorus voltai TaxID=2609070 RepID=A0AAD8ZW47_9TELE|nr:hypothetical protein P4O66_004920 [Electrophorus voltai]